MNIQFIVAGIILGEVFIVKIIIQKTRDLCYEVNPRSSRPFHLYQGDENSNGKIARKL